MLLPYKILVTNQSVKKVHCQRIIRIIYNMNLKKLIDKLIQI